MRAASAFLLTTLLLAGSGSAFARTLPSRGAAHKPRTFKIQEPFPCGTAVRVSCAYGSRAHKRVKSNTSTNDHYAIDLVRDEPGNGAGKPVVAVADGVVRLAGWAKRGFKPYGKLVYIEHDFRDRRGRTYHSLYAHLSGVGVRPGDRVTAGTVIGTLGGSSKRRQRVFGPHLHFAMYVGAHHYLGGGQAVVPEPLGQHEDLRRGVAITACAASAPDAVALDLPLSREAAAAVGGLNAR